MRHILISTVALIALSATASADSILFSRSFDYTAGNNPSAVFASDLDMDGDKDVIVSCSYPYSPLSIYINNGGGSFQTPTNYWCGAGHLSIWSADFDQDIDNDVVVGTYNVQGGCFLVVLKNNGNGILQADSSYSILGGLPGIGDGQLFGADFDNDGDVDLAVTEMSGNILILKNNGDGKFQIDSSYEVGPGLYCVRGADLNGDGYYDLATANEEDSNISVLFNLGNGDFSAAQNYQVSCGARSLTIADFNGDSLPDLAVSNYYTNMISLLFNCGGGNFCLDNSIMGIESPGSIRSADFDNDGDIDLVAAESHGSQMPHCTEVIIFENINFGEFEVSSSHLYTGECPMSLFDTDIDSDDDVDLLAVNYYSNTLSVLLNLDDREAPSKPVILAPPNGASIDSSAYLVWLESTCQSCAGAASYSMQISEEDDSLFYCPIISISNIDYFLTTDLAIAVRLGDVITSGQLVPGLRYFWKLRGDFADGISSHWTDGSSWFVFMAQNHAPSPPDSGFSPANGEEVIPLRPVITWNIADDPDPDDYGDNLSYAIRLSTDSLFIGFVLNDTTAMGINQIQTVADLADNTRYFYSIKTIDDGGLSSDWSDIQHFWTNHYNFPPEPFPLIAPNNGQKQVVYYTHFSWGSTVDYDPNSSFTFSVQYSPDSLFRYDVGGITNLADTAISIVTDSLAPSGHVYWRVLAIDDDSLSRTGGLPEGPRSLLVIPPGDANTNGITNGIDVTFMVAYLKGQGAAPDPIQAGDANGNCTTNGIDVTYMVAYLKGIGAPPVRPDCGISKARDLTQKRQGLR